MSDRKPERPASIRPPSMRPPSMRPSGEPRMLPDERRRGPDRWSRGLAGASLLGWALLFFGALCVVNAIPQTDKFSLAWGEARPRDWWASEWLEMALAFFFGGLLVGAAGLIVNVRRKRRRHDRYSASLAMLLVVSVVSILAWLLRVDI